jgi:pSer/pThr/pTyr-binding forkhead associated (FHA) protein
MREQLIASEKTMGKQFDPVTGWLVCVGGIEIGRDYRIHSGMNAIGRSVDMDIQIVDDTKISQSNHCKIVYDPALNNFYILPFSGSLVYLNDKEITKPERLEKDDHIRIGKSNFVFIPYCEGNRKWG